MSLDLVQWTEAFRWRRPTALTLSLIPVAIGLDYAGHALVKGAGLPLFLDSVGTILIGLLAGPWIGGLAGFFTNLISANTVDPIAAPYSIVSLLLGFGAGIAGYLGWPRRRIGWLALAIMCFAIASIGSTPLNLALYQGQSGVFLGDAIDKALIGAHFPSIVAAYLGEAAVDLPDKLLTALVVLLVYRALPWYRSPGTNELIGPAPAYRALSPLVAIKVTSLLAVGRVSAVMAIIIAVTGCSTSSSDPKPAAMSAPSVPSVAALTAVADQVFPLYAKYGQTAARRLTAGDPDWSRGRGQDPARAPGRRRNALDIARPGGAVSRVGVPQDSRSPVGVAFWKNVGIAGGPAPARAYTAELLTDVLDGRIEPGRVFDRVGPLDEVPDGYRAMNDREAIKFLIEL